MSTETKAVSQDLRFVFPKPARVQNAALVWDKDLECLVPKYGRNYHDTSDLRSDLPSPAVHGGGMPTIKSMADGQYYETKRNYYKSVSRAGAEIVGFDPRWQEHVKAPQPFGGDKAHEASLVADTKAAIQIEESKLPPTGGREWRSLARKQKRARRAAP